MVLYNSGMYIVHPFQIPVKRSLKNLKTRWAVYDKERPRDVVATFDTEQEATDFVDEVVLQLQIIFKERNL